MKPSNRGCIASRIAVNLDRHRPGSKIRTKVGEANIIDPVSAVINERGLGYILLTFLATLAAATHCLGRLLQAPAERSHLERESRDDAPSF